jgi:hypothetical protein
MFFSLAGCVSKANSGSSFDPAAFVIKVNVTSVAGSSGYNSFIINLDATATYHLYIDWGDGSTETFNGSAAGITHAFMDGLGPHYVVIKATTSDGLPRLILGAIDDGLKIQEVAQWGTNVWSSFVSMFAGCYNLTLTATDLPDTHLVTDFTSAWAFCYNITGTFPLIDTSAATTLQAAWRGCSSLTSFPLIDTANVTDFTYAWYDCSDLTSFPLLNMGAGAGVDISHAWQQCSGLTSFPDIDFIHVTACVSAWSNCVSLTSFNITSGFQSCTDFTGAWLYCYGMTSFDSTIFSSHSYGSAFIKFDSAFANCAGLAALTTSSNIITTLFAHFDAVSSAVSMFDNVELSPEFYELALYTLAAGNSPAVKNNVEISFGTSQYHIEDGGAYKATLIDTYNWTVFDGGSISSSHSCLEYCASVSKTLYQISSATGAINTGFPVYADSIGRLYTGYVVDGPAACGVYPTLRITTGTVIDSSSTCNAYDYSYTFWNYSTSTYTALWTYNGGIDPTSYASVSSVLWATEACSLPSNILCPGSPVLASGQYSYDPVYGTNIFTAADGQVVSTP